MRVVIKRPGEQPLPHDIPNELERVQALVAGPLQVCHIEPHFERWNIVVYCNEEADAHWKTDKPPLNINTPSRGDIIGPVVAVLTDRNGNNLPMDHSAESRAKSLLARWAVPLLLALVFVAGCGNVRNPAYCDIDADCKAGQICDREYHGCLAVDASLPTDVAPDMMEDAGPGVAHLDFAPLAPQLAGLGVKAKVAGAIGNSYRVALSGNGPCPGPIDVYFQEYPTGDFLIAYCGSSTTLGDFVYKLARTVPDDPDFPSFTFTGSIAGGSSTSFVSDHFDWTNLTGGS